ncbi:FGGY-family carbohydrate kinase [Bradyrhizobium sp. 15]|uniref:FGGY-family carbohydrate kinase n=1 Tax=Bradyrhizobium sp. 15 TaxID=2782633 RepID=UPI001FF9FE47|nr:FGGY-family carbohydrate kinase [Bradyrhizobium sp. 15]
MAYVFGTSACTMSSINEGAFVRKALFFAMLPGLWLNEGGKSAAGAAIDHLGRMHLTPEEASKLARAMGAASAIRCRLGGATRRGFRRGLISSAICMSCLNLLVTVRRLRIPTRED